MKSILVILDYVFLTRPILMFPGWTTLLAGYWIADGLALGNNFIRFPTVDMLFMSGFVGFGTAMGSIFILNQLNDIESDRQNNKLFLLGNGYITPVNGWIFAVILAVMSLILASIVNVELTLVIIVFLIIAGYGYNFPPLVCKDYPIRGLLANMAMGELAFLAGWVQIGSLNAEALVASLPILFYNTALYLLTTLPDSIGDRNTDKITIAVRLGHRKTLIAAVGIFLLALISALLLNCDLIFWLCLILLPLQLKALLPEATIDSAVLLLKMGILFLSLAICIKFPLFFAMMGVAFFTSRWYYRRRFNLLYPTFGA